MAQKNQKNTVAEAEACQKKSPVCKLAFVGAVLLFAVFQISQIKKATGII